MERMHLLADAPWLVLLHLATVLPAAVLGGYLLCARKGGARHRALGKVYLALMAAAALSTLALPAFVGPTLRLGPLRLGHLHLFVPLTLHGVWKAFHTIKKGDIHGHKWAMISLYSGALVIAGVLSFAPGRLMHRLWLG